jgi:hypothetical protein
MDESERVEMEGALSTHSSVDDFSKFGFGFFDDRIF